MQNSNTGIVGYGCYIPKYRIRIEEIAKVWNTNPESIKKSLLVTEKSVPDIDEDTITISVQAAENAIKRASINPAKIGALYIGSESHPYAVKPSGTVVAESIGATPDIMTADYEFACKAGTAAMQTCLALVKSNMIEYGMAIGADTAQSRPGDALEYTAAAGGAAFIIGNNPAVIIDSTFSFTTDTPDFWRRDLQSYPKHGARFTGEPAYFKHIISATKGLFEKTGTRPSDYDYVIFHMPNGKFPLNASKILGFSKQQILPGLVVQKIGNTYSGSSLLGLCSILDIAKPNQKILLTSFGSGAGSDSFAFTVTDNLPEIQNKAPKTEYYINKKQYIEYGTYVKLRQKLKT